MSNTARTVKAHPFAVLTYLKPFVFVLLIPLIRAVLRYIMDGEITNVLFAESFAAAAIITYAVIRWRVFSITVKDGFVEIQSGVFNRKVAHIDINRISTVETTRNPFDVVFGSATLRINTEAGSIRRADYEMKVSARDADYITEVISTPGKRIKWKFSVLRVAIMAAATSSAFTGMIIAVPLINQSGNLLGLALEELMLQRINEVGELFGRYIPPIVNTITIIFLLCYFLAFIYSLLKFVNFKLTLTGSDIEISSGFFSRRRIRFRAEAVNDVCIEQSFILRLFRRCMLRVEIGGYGQDKGERAIVVPSVRKKDAVDQFKLIFPTVTIDNVAVRPHNKSRARFLSLPLGWMMALLGGMAVLWAVFVSFRDLILFLSLIGITILLYFCNLADENYKNGRIGISKIITARYSRWNKLCETYCDASRVGVITVLKLPLDKLYDTCNVRITVCSEAADSILVKHIPYKELIEQLDRQYKIYE